MIDAHHEELAALYALHLLDGPELAAFERALAADPALRALVDSLREPTAALAHTAPFAEPPAALRARVLAAVTARPPAPVIQFATYNFPLLRFAPLAAAACFALLAAWFGARAYTARTDADLAAHQTALADLARKSTRQQLEAERLITRAHLAALDETLAREQSRAAAAERLATAHQELLALRDGQLAQASQRTALADSALAAARHDLTAAHTDLTAARTEFAAILEKSHRDHDLAQFKIATLASLLHNSPKALAVAVWNPTTQQGILSVEQLPALAADEDYQLWLVDPQYPIPVDGGVFTVDPKTGVARLDFKPGKPVAQVAKFAISRERKGGVVKAEGPIVLLGGP